MLVDLPEREGSAFTGRDESAGRVLPWAVRRQVKLGFSWKLVGVGWGRTWCGVGWFGWGELGQTTRRPSI